MNPNRSTEETLLEQALAFASAEARLAYLQGACGGDEQLRARVQALIAAHEAAGGFLADTTTVGMPDVPSAPQLEEGPGAVIGHYKLLQKIGEGGFGAVYMAEQTEPVRRRVALKVIKLGMDTKAVIARFEAERQALALMDHPNIAKVLDAGATGTGRPYFVMELVKGIRITDYCDQNNLSTNERLGLFMQVCHAIQHAHQKGIIHRDIKPSNILVTLHDGVPVPKVIDFGIAKATTDQRLTDKTLFTAFEQFLGTPAYMSPEQAEMSGLDIDTRSDIYSLGVLLYELLAGSTPFDAKELLASGIDAMRKTIREKEPVRPSTRFATLKDEELTTTAKHRSTDTTKLLHQLRGDLDWIVMKALEKDRTRRYETTNGLAQDIQRHLNNELVAARPPSTTYKLQKLVRRNRTAFATATVVVLALLIGVIVSTWQAVVANRAKSEAVQAKTNEKEQRLAAQKERDNAVTAQQAEQQARLQADAQRAEADHNLYVANMSLAQQAWDENNLVRLRQVLDETKDSPHRGFEWYYWQKQTHLALKTLRGHLDIVSAVYSPDGQRILTGSGDHTAKVWDASSGRELLTLKGHSQWVVVAYSPDGQRILTGSGDGTAKVWEAVTGRALLTLNWPTNAFRSVAFSPDGRRGVAGSALGTVRVWELASGRELLTVNAHNAEVDSVAFSPDGQRIVTCSWDEPAKVWEAATGQALLTLGRQGDAAGSASYSPDGQRIVAVGTGSAAKVWDAASGRELLDFNGLTGGFVSAAFSPDGQRIVTGHSDSTAKVWDATSGRELFALKGHSERITSVAFSPDGHRIITGSWDKTVKVWEAIGAPEMRPLIGQTGTVFTVAYSRDGQRIVTCSYVTGSNDTAARLWDATSGRELLRLEGKTNQVLSVAFSPDGQRIVTGSSDGTATLWDASSGREVLTLKGHSEAVGSVAFSVDGQRIVTGGGDMTAKVWDVSTGRELFALAEHPNGVGYVAYSPDGRRIVTGGWDGTVKVWEAISGRELFELKGHSSGSILSVDFSPGGQRIVTGSSDGTARVWDATSGKELLTLKGFLGYGSAAFSPDGRRIITTAGRRTAKVWEAASGRELLTLKAPSGFECVTFSSDGQRILARSAERTPMAWEAARAEQVAGWQEEERAAAESISALEAERKAEQEHQRIAHERESIKHWLLLGPIPLDPGQSVPEALDIEQIKGEDWLLPTAGDTKSFGGRELKWREVKLTDAVNGFNEVLGREATQSVAYAVCYLRSEADQRELKLHVGRGLDTAGRIYLNAKKIYESSGFGVGLGIYEPPYVALNAGLNVMVFKVVSGRAGWRDCSICLTDAQGNPVKGVTVTLNPEAKEKAEVKKP